MTPLEQASLKLYHAAVPVAELLWGDDGEGDALMRAICDWMDAWMRSTPSGNSQGEAA